SVLIERIGEKNTTISQLRALLSKPSTEKTSKVLEQAGIKVPPQNPPPSKAKDPPKPGHGRNGAQAYRGAERIKIAHGSLQPGNHCPGCLKGKVYLQKEPGIRIRVMGQAPIAAQVYELERLRCNLCGEVYEAEAPQEVGEKKYDESAAAMIALLKYGSGVPWDRLERLEASLGIPLPASTQCEIVAERAEVIRPAFEELIRQEAQGEVGNSLGKLQRARPAPLRRGDAELPRGVPVRAGKLSRRVWLRGRGPAAGSRARGAAALSPGAQPAGDGCPPRLVPGPVQRKESGAQLGSGRSHHLLLETLDSADAVPPPSGRAAGFEPRRAGSEEMHFASKE